MCLVDSFLLLPMVLTSETQKLQYHRMTKFSHLGFVTTGMAPASTISEHQATLDINTGWLQPCPQCHLLPQFETLVPLKNHHFAFTQRVSIYITSLSSMYKKITREILGKFKCLFNFSKYKRHTTAFLCTSLKLVDGS